MCILKNNSKRPAQVIFINFVYILPKIYFFRIFS